ncbi:MAG TPA: hypothetical protein VEC08_03905, partial [Nitrososphaerales archaeon]|nr:hypothetical protein [Nitrososphaerales archaeon]
PLGAHGLAWNGPWIPLGPGTYRVTFLVDVLSAGSSITLDSVYNAGNTTLAEKLVTFPAVGPSNASLDITLSGIVPQTEFRGTVGAGQSANLDFEGVEISQISAP